MDNLEAGYQADIDAMEAQYQADFTEWFNTIQGQLSGDVAANLANQIAAINSVIGSAQLTTVAQDLRAAINELLTGLNTKANSTDLATHKAEEAQYRLNQFYRNVMGVGY